MANANSSPYQSNGNSQKDPVQRTTPGLARAVFLDRDGTLNRDPGYLNDPNQLELFDHVVAALESLKTHGYLLFVVTNQSGVARGKITQSQLNAIHQRLNEECLSERSRITDFGICLHHPDESCECRKPKPRLIQQLAERWRLDLSQSFVIGDRHSDLLLKKSAGLKGAALVRTGWGSDTEQTLKSSEADFIGDHLLEVAQWIVKQ